jgi:tRNA(Arg) A34 adenosine deaminase TadA
MGEVPAGAMIAQGGEILSVAANRTVRDKDATAHAELLAIREACAKLDSERLIDCDLYVTLEPPCFVKYTIARTRLSVQFGTNRPVTPGNTSSLPTRVLVRPAIPDLVSR